MALDSEESEEKSPSPVRISFFICIIVSASRAIFNFSGAVGVLGMDFRERRNDDRNAPSGQTKFRLSLAA